MVNIPDELVEAVGRPDEPLPVNVIVLPANPKRGRGSPQVFNLHHFSVGQFCSRKFRAIQDIRDGTNQDEKVQCRDCV